MGNIRRKKIGDQLPVILSQMHVSLLALQCLVCAGESNPLTPVSADVQPGAVLAGTW